MSRLSRRGTAFTLTELLVVITILGILSSLMLAGLLGARERQRAVKSSTTIRKLSEVILPFYESYEVRRPSLPSSPSITTLPTACYKELRRIATRRLMTLELPDRGIDVIPGIHALKPNVGDLAQDELEPLNKIAIANGVTLTEIPPAARRYASIIKSGSTAWVDAGKNPNEFSVESDELLHMIVTRGPVADSDVVAHFRPDEVGDIDGDGLLEFIDGWGRPISFLRWPVGFASPVQPIAGTLLGIDTMVSEKGHRLVPLIFSAGSDGKFDIGENVKARKNGEKPGPYSDYNFDPFFYDGSRADNPNRMNCFAAQSLRHAVNLVPVSLGPSGKTLTFQAERVTAGSVVKPNAFQAIGSERDQDDDGVVQSLDNVHNHDLTR